ncbi:hypothetical protein SAMD00019534_112420, partial [Acytostelium subglobosum LB1]|uniref:hypothetical protein n=1 Tax=Acytostelium subglobosum LB1 TaxID=1410327 RepID=UPI000644F8AD
MLGQIERELSKLIIKEMSTMNNNNIEDPTRVLIIENIDNVSSDIIQSMIDNNSFGIDKVSLVVSKYIPILRSLIMVFKNRDDSFSVKLFLEGQSLAFNSSTNNIYFGKDISDQFIKRYQSKQHQRYLSPATIKARSPYHQCYEKLPSFPLSLDNSAESLSTINEIIYKDITSNGFPSITLEYCV